MVIHLGYAGRNCGLNHFANFETQTYLFFGPVDFVSWSLANSLPLLQDSLLWLGVVLFDGEVGLGGRVEVAGLRILALGCVENHHV